MTPTQLDVQALGDVARNYMSGFRDSSKVLQRTGKVIDQTDFPVRKKIRVERFKSLLQQNNFFHEITVKVYQVMFKVGKLRFKITAFCLQNP